MATVEQLVNLGQVVRVRRSELRLTQSDLAKQAGVSKSWVSNIERAYVHPERGPVAPSDATLNSMASALGLPVEKFHAALGRFDNGDSDEADRRFLAQYRALNPEQREVIGAMLRVLSPEERADVTQKAEELLAFANESLDRRGIKRIPRD